uniref:Uncharacterized protein n=1 Tax=Trichuris muris TaxID=70415 RepID=A0A5S6QL68_TRIMR
MMAGVARRTSAVGCRPHVGDGCYRNDAESDNWPIRYAGLNEVLFYTICCHLVPLHRLNDMCDSLCSLHEMRQVREGM